MYNEVQQYTGLRSSSTAQILRRKILGTSSNHSLLVTFSSERVLLRNRSSLPKEGVCMRKKIHTVHKASFALQRFPSCYSCYTQEGVSMLLLYVMVYLVCCTVIELDFCRLVCYFHQFFRWSCMLGMLLVFATAAAEIHFSFARRKKKKNDY